VRRPRQPQGSLLTPRWSKADSNPRSRSCERDHGVLPKGALGTTSRVPNQSSGRLCHGNSIEHALRAKARQASCRCDGILPLCGSFGPEDPQCGSGDEVALKVEGIVNRTVHAEEALGGSSRLEPLQLTLASSDCLMRILRPIVFPKPLPHADRSVEDVGARRRRSAACR
jgi:hypothetical protein